MIRLIKECPAIGWVKGNLVTNDGDAKEILKLKRRIEELESQLVSSMTEAPAGAEKLSQGDELF
ncbi:hypothetical protein LNN85_20770 [Klebsiella pneumoniae subsp. pneumoniae]|nr:hypothetical protein [Klebsiella pneumoniae subsp. pneumoniae]